MASLSLIITTFNRPERALKAVQSACQSKAFGEVVVVDDATPGLPADWRDAVQAIDPRVRVHVLPQNGGCSVARNEGLRMMSGTHFMVLDDDDAVIPRGVDKLWSKAMRNEQTVWVGMLQTEEKGRITGRRWPAATRKGEVWGLDESRMNGKFFSWNVKQTAIIPKRLVDQVGQFDPQFHIRQWTELFYRLSEVAPVRRLFTPVYLLNRDGDLDRLTAHVDERVSDFEKLQAKHRDLLHKSPKRMRVLVSNHAQRMGH